MKKCFLLVSILLILLTLSGCATLFHKENVPANKYVHNKTQKVVEVHSNRSKYDDATQISRYTTIQNGPTESEVNPLMAISTFNFPPSIYTVGQAVHQVLATTGYQLAPHLSPYVKKTLRESLPFTDRKLGPMTIQSVLDVLMGADVYELERDPLNRLVNFKLTVSIRRIERKKMNTLSKKSNSVPQYMPWGMALSSFKR